MEDPECPEGVLEATLQRSVASANEHDKSRKNDLDRMEKQSSNYGFFIPINVPYDGNCFFHALSHHLGGRRVDWLRRDLVFFLKTKKCGPLKDALDEGFLNDLAKNGSDVKDQRVVQGMATFLGRNIQVLTCKEDGAAVLQLFRPHGKKGKNTASTLVIGHIEDHHFVPLLRKNSSSHEGMKRSSSVSSLETDVQNQKRPRETEYCESESHSTTASSSSDADPLSVAGESAALRGTSTRVRSPSADCPQSIIIPNNAADHTLLDAAPSATSDSTSSVDRYLPTDADSDVSDLLEPTDASLGDGGTPPILGDTCSGKTDGQFLPDGSSTEDATPPPVSDDIGRTLKATMTSKEAIAAIDALSPGQKYNLLTNHIRPAPSYIYPCIYMNKCNRAFNRKWLDKYPWLVYSPSLDGVFCIYCALFARQRESKGALVNTPFTKWTKISDTLKNHAAGSHHASAISDALTFKHSLENPSQTLPCMINTDKQRRIEENKHILKLITKAVLHCGRQCQALRGKTEHDDEKNPGNFLATLKLLSESEPLLKRHIETPEKKNVHYMSPSSQNEVIQIIGDMIQRSIIDQIKAAKFYTIMADEVSCHNKEQMPLCIRFVDETNTPREEFIEFISLVRITGLAIGKEIEAALDRLTLPIEDIRGQGYDGASSMSSAKNGVQGYIKRLSPLAVYTHCSGHCLNLVIVHACKLVGVRNMLDKVKETCLFFNNSPKRETLLKDIIKTDLPETSRRKPLLDLCATRWAERQEAYRHFYQAYVHMITALEVIVFGMHQDKGYNPLLTGRDWDPTTKSNANAILHTLTTFDFIITFVTVYMLLSRLEGISVKLQKKAIDIFDAYNLIQSVKEEYAKMRQDINAHFNRWFLHAQRMAEKVGEYPRMPRTAGRQQHRSNTPAETSCSCPEPCYCSVRSYYLRNLAIPFLEHVMNDLEAQFSGLANKCSRLLGLVPAVICDRDVDLSEAVSMYSGDLPSPETVEEELVGWRDVNMEKVAHDRAVTCMQALRECNKIRFPNIHTLLRIACTLPVTSCECERSCSVLRRLSNYMRSTMCQDRLTALALMHIHYSHPVDLDLVVRRFMELHPRKMELGSLLYDK